MLKRTVISSAVALGSLEMKNISAAHQRTPDIERKEFGLDIKVEEKENGDGNFRFEALGSTFGNIDLTDDVMVAGCFKESLKKEIPVILWQHNRDEPIGMPEAIKETKNGLELTVVMPADDEFVKGRVMPQLRIGSIKSMSIGFRIQDFYIKDDIRFITKVQLKEVSLVTFPANPQAVVTAVKHLNEGEALKFAERSYEWDRDGAFKRVEEYLEETKDSNLRMRDCYLVTESVDEKTNGFQLPFIDIVDGEPHVVPKALAAIKASIKSEEIELETEIKNEVLEVLTQYEKELDEVHPREMLTKSDVETMSKRDLEKALRDSGLFSKEAAVIVASNFPETGDPHDGEVNEEKLLEACNTVLAAGETKKADPLNEEDVLVTINNLFNL